jgi:hypothetical protein
MLPKIYLEFGHGDLGKDSKLLVRKKNLICAGFFFSF